MPDSHSNGAVKICILDLQRRMLPQAYALQKRLQAGAEPEEYDLEFLALLHKELQNLQSIALQHPEHHLTIGNMIQLYSSLVSLAVANTPKAPQG
ncbi:hypothetical protein [Neptuniibacter halophilus]|uniref:hypothetical protein n=1 Tax=Neptuniibacter halophilus TaxID=651666 RepID=UPI0025740E70|nr:hypothetical protein [Neptuniibacter halophilus]